MAQTAISWHDLSYTVRKSNYWGLGGFTQTKILHEISGSVQAGELVAIMGPSGAGKSTFLDTLCDRVDTVTNKLEGDIKVFGRKLQKQDFTYVTQEDALEGVLSIRENLRYSAYLRLPSSMSVSQKNDRVEEVITELGLRKCADSWIGHKFFRGVSGGERRRTSIGMELVVDSPIMFLDEPTSGLDSKTSHKLVKLLKGLCGNNRTIICTIHQPSSYVFSLFDKVLFLAGGHCVYFGPVKGAKSFFESQGHFVPELTNPADFYMGLLNTDFDMKEDKEKRLESISSLKLAQTQSQQHLMATESNLIENVEWKGKKANGPKYQTNIFVQTWYLTTRLMKINSRDPIPFYSRVMQYIMMGIIIGTLYLQIPFETDYIGDKVGVIFCMACFVIWFPVSTLEAFLGSKQQFLKERTNGYYSVLPFALAGSIVNTLMCIVFNICFTISLYWLVGLRAQAEAFFYAFLMMNGIICSAEATVTLVSSIVNTFIVGIACITFFNLICILACGFLIQASSIPGWWIWVYWITPLHYSFEGLMANEFGSGANSSYACNYVVNSTECICAYPDLDGDCTNSDLEIAYFFGVQDINKWGYYGVVVGFIIFLRVAYYLVLRFFNTGKK